MVTRKIIVKTIIATLLKTKINVFGDIHDKPLDERFNKSNHICVSCDVIDYTPIVIEIK